MRKFFWHVLLASPTLLVAQGLFSQQAIAAPDSSAAKPSAVAQTPNSGNSVSVDEFIRVTETQSLGSGSSTSMDELSQVTDIDQLSDVKPTDWAFQALQSLVERYGCIAGYPDGTYRGNRAMTRYEFAAGLNACLDKLAEELDIGPGTDPEALATIRRLQEEFKGELATLRGRVDALEARTAELEANQFSTTTKLQGEAVFGLAVANGFGDEDGDDDDDDDDVKSSDIRGREEVVFQDRVRLSFVTNFDERNQLITRLDASNAQALTASGQGATTYQTSFDPTTGATANDVTLGWLAYYYNGDKFQVYLPAAGALWQDFVPTISPYFEGATGANNSLTSFGESNPIYKIGLASGGGLGFNYFLSEKLTFSAGYFGGNSFSPTDKNGLFNGEYSMLGQLAYQGDKFQLGFTYVNAYIDQDDENNGNAIFDTLVGSSLSRNPFGASAITNSYGVSAAIMPSEKFSFNAFGGFTDARQVANATGGDKDDAQIWYYGAGLAFPDFGGSGNLLGLQAGVEPYVGGFDDSNTEGQKNPINIQGFYRMAVNDHINITPGAIYLINPNGQDESSVLIGVIRTTFNF